MSQQLSTRRGGFPSTAEKLIKKLVVIVSPLLKIIATLFYSKEYLRGRWFENNHIGWLWVVRGLIWQKLLGFNRRVPWPVSPFIKISNPSNLIFHPDDLNNFQSYGIYFQNFAAKIVIGRGTYIAPNVGLITANHDPTDLDRHLPGEDIIISENCWIGMNAVILPGVKLGPRTIVGAGAVVTRSFEEGNCVIAGNPARIIKRLEGKMKDKT